MAFAVVCLVGGVFFAAVGVIMVLDAEAPAAGLIMVLLGIIGVVRGVLSLRRLGPKDQAGRRRRGSSFGGSVFSGFSGSGGDGGGCGGDGGGGGGSC